MTDATLLMRQVHPGFVQLGRATSQVFKPTPKDENRLSVYDNDLISPDLAWKHYTATLSQLSEGVLAVAVSECTAESLAVAPDPGYFPEHAIIHFADCGRKAMERKAKALHRAASERGWLHLRAADR